MRFLLRLYFFLVAYFILKWMGIVELVRNNWTFSICFVKCRFVESNDRQNNWSYSLQMHLWMFIIPIQTVKRRQMKNLNALGTHIIYRFLNSITQIDSPNTILYWTHFQVFDFFQVFACDTFESRSIIFDQLSVYFIWLFLLFGFRSFHVVFLSSW